MHDQINKCLHTVILLLVIAIAGSFLWDYHHPDSKKVIDTNTEKLATESGAKEILNQAGTLITQGQSKEIAEEVKKTIPDPATGDVKKEPDKKWSFTGFDLKEHLKQMAKKYDAVVVTKTDKPKESVDPKTIPDQQPVNLNEYNITAYPKQLWTIGHGTHTEMLMWQGKKHLFKAQGYLGVAATWDRRNSRNSDVMITFTIPK